MMAENEEDPEYTVYVLLIPGYFVYFRLGTLG